ncbi:FAD dependent oxidoreductase [Dactylonectria estremocensis]|uniref:FAD dependent oxidoreductase n=1 Tax=Dactylonectria estremocensis TaxID=1079267 RepID=A0A9P9EL43_9HYPO|nr:FAD dependent oxidoreductase [Dactylonectria estremocensis]
MASPASYLIVGAGVFGVSTAYHLLKKYPGASVTLVDRDAFDAADRVAASWDWNKVVRADYDDFVYCRLAIEAQDVFETDPDWMPYFTKSGVYWMCRSAYARDVIANHEKLGRADDISAVPIAEARKMYGGLFDKADYSDVTEVLINKSSGWAAAGDALRAITRKSIDMGLNYVTAQVTSLRFDKSGACRGAKIASGEVLTASHVILCTGAYTATLLEQSAAVSGLTSLRSEHRIVAGGITTGMRKLSDDVYPKFANMPVGFQGYSAEVGGFIGSLPPTPDTHEMKWWGQTIFKNTKEVLPGRYVSVPPSAPDYAQWKVSRQLKDDIKHAAEVFYGSETDSWTFDKHRICWDAFTSSGDFIISPHAAAKGLYVATCGSFHGYKFFPVLGKYIVQMLEGELEDELAQKWAWDRARPDAMLNPEFPRAEMVDLYDTVSKL